MSSIRTPVIRLEDYRAEFETVEQAMEALGLRRATFYDWRNAGLELIPDPWAFKAKAVLDGLSGVS